MEPSFIRPVSGLFRGVTTVFCVLVVALPGACQDAIPGPLAVVINEETRAALSLDVAVPSLPSVAAGVGSDGAVSRERLDRWVGAWEASWLADPDEGRTARRALYDDAVEALARAVGTAGVRSAVDGAEGAVRATDDVDLSRLPEVYRRRIAAARDLSAEARRALEADRPAEALWRAFLAGDQLRHASPRSVAVMLVERAEEAQRRVPEVSTYSRDDRERIARLIRNARDAVEDGDYPLAIHRAYYACRLLDVEIP